MVIQRSWKILNDVGSTSNPSTEANRSPSGIQPSSDDSDCSNQTTHSMVTSVASPTVTKQEVHPSTNAMNTEPMKFVTTSEMADTVLKRLKHRFGYTISAAGTGTTPESAMRSLELLRICVQQSFDKEVEVIMKRYMNDYFEPAIKNIQENLGQKVLSMDTKMSCALLENSKAQFNSFRTRSQNNLVNCNEISDDSPGLRVALKRSATKPFDINEMPRKVIPTTVTQSAQDQIVIDGVMKTTFTLSPPMLQSKPSLVAARRQIFWNTAHISTTTKFVLDVQANQAFGFGTDGKERLASKHPELIRYLPDSEDRDWLISHNIISAHNRSSRFLFLIYDELCRLHQTHEIYRNKSTINLNIMHTFCVPEFMIQKMKLFFVDLNIKSRGLITNSFSTQTNSHLRNALLQGTHANGKNINTTCVSKISEITSDNINISANETMSSYTVSVCSTATSCDLIQQSKPSTLSSSHATLTALLNNSTNTNDKNAVTKHCK